jgi:hypothetical protein
MAPSRKPPEPGSAPRLNIRLPLDVFERVAAKAKAEGRPINRVVINELAAFPHLDRQNDFDQSVSTMKNLLARHGARLTATELNGDLLQALDAALAARTAGQLEPQLDRLRVIRGALLENERQVAKDEREQLAAQIKLLERQIAAIEALPDSAIVKDELPGRRREIERLQRAAAINAAADRKAAE